MSAFRYICCVYCYKITNYDSGAHYMCKDCLNRFAKKHLGNNMGMEPPPPKLPHFISPEEVEKRRNEVLRIDFSIRPKTIQKEEEDLKLEESLKKIRRENAIALDAVLQRNKPDYLRHYEFEREYFSSRPNIITHEEVERQLDDALRSISTPEEELAHVKKINKFYKVWSIPASLFLYYTVYGLMCFVFAFPFSFISAITGSIMTLAIAYFFHFKPAKKKIRIAEEEYNRTMEPIWDKIIEEDDQEQYEARNARESEEKHGNIQRAIV